VRDAQTECDARRFNGGERQGNVGFPAVNQFGKSYDPPAAGEEFADRCAPAMFSDDAIRDA